MLHGRYEGKEITEAEEQQAIKLGYVVVFGYSDDNMEFRGGINDEVSCFDGGEAYITEDGLFEECECACIHYNKAKAEAHLIEALWHNKGEYCWTYETEIPHETFDILDEEGFPWCKGIVFDINNLEQK